MRQPCTREFQPVAAEGNLGRGKYSHLRLRHEFPDLRDRLGEARVNGGLVRAMHQTRL